MHCAVYLSDHEATFTSSISSWLSTISTFPQPKMLTSCIMTVRLGNTSSNTNWIVAVLLFPASLVTVSVSVHDFLATSPELTAIPENLNSTLQFFVTLSDHEATSLSPTYSSLSLIRIFSTPMISMVEYSTLMEGMEVSFAISSLVQEANMIHIPMMMAVARNAATGKCLVVRNLLFQVIRYRFVICGLFCAASERLPGVRIETPVGETTVYLVPIHGRQPCQLASISLCSLLWHTFCSPPLHRLVRSLLCWQLDCERR